MPRANVERTGRHKWVNAFVHIYHWTCNTVGTLCLCTYGMCSSIQSCSGEETRIAIDDSPRCCCKGKIAGFFAPIGGCLFELFVNSS